MFEDVEVHCPNNLDSILTQIYGDYMKLPPESERYNHITQKIDFGPYEDMIYNFPYFFSIFFIN